MAENELKIGIVGLGLGQWQVNTVELIEGAKVVAVADNNIERVLLGDPPGIGEGNESYEAYGEKHDVRIYDDAVKMMDAEELDGVSLAVAPKFRKALIQEAGMRKISMLVEKPWAGSVEQAEALVQLVRELDAKAMVEFPIRFMPVMVRLRELMDNELGAGWIANANLMMGWCPEPENGHWDPANHNGLINECYTHLFDTLNFYMGKPVSVDAGGGIFRGSPLPDGAAGIVKYESGGCAAFTCGGVGAFGADGGNLLEIWTENGMARVTGTQWLPNQLTWATRDMEEAIEETFPAVGRFTIMEYNMRAWFDSIRSEEAPPCSPEMGQKATEVALAVQNSILQSTPQSL